MFWQSSIMTRSPQGRHQYWTKFLRKNYKMCMETLRRNSVLVWSNIPSCSANESLCLGSEFSVSLQATSSGFPLLFFLFFGDTVAEVLQAERKITYCQYVRAIGQPVELNHWKDLARSCLKWGSYRGEGGGWHCSWAEKIVNHESRISKFHFQESWK